MIRVDDLRKGYGGRPVLRGLQLRFERGSVYGLVGENGAGKTTLFRCLAGLESYTGSIHSELNPLKDHLGFLPTDPPLLSYLTGREYLRFVCQARGVQPERLDERNVFDLPLDQYAVNYSTGMKKKLALLGVLFQQNEVFILDEPFNGVDIQSNLLISEIISALRDLGKTVLLSSHIFDTLRPVCDEIGLLREGQITESVKRGDFDRIEAEMRRVSIRGAVDRLGLS